MMHPASGSSGGPPPTDSQPGPKVLGKRGAPLTIPFPTATATASAPPPAHYTQQGVALSATPPSQPFTLPSGGMQSVSHLAPSMQMYFGPGGMMAAPTSSNPYPGYHLGQGGYSTDAAVAAAAAAQMSMAGAHQLMYPGMPRMMEMGYGQASYLQPHQQQQLLWQQQAAAAAQQQPVLGLHPGVKAPPPPQTPSLYTAATDGMYALPALGGSNATGLGVNVFPLPNNPLSAATGIAPPTGSATHQGASVCVPELTQHLQGMFPLGGVTSAAGSERCSPIRSSGGTIATQDDILSLHTEDGRRAVAVPGYEGLAAEDIDFLAGIGGSDEGREEGHSLLPYS